MEAFALTVRAEVLDPSIGRINLLANRRSPAILFATFLALISVLRGFIRP